MDKNYDHLKYEAEIYRKWEAGGAFKANQSGEPYTVLMPPPNANASLHAGHAMYTVDDIMVRWKRMQGMAAVWIPGMDHAGFETQFVYEKHLAKAGKSRMDFDRQTLYENVYKFVKENSGLIYQQFRRLGFSADWERSVFTLDPRVLSRVWTTFKQMESEGKVYRDEYIVNFCTHCGTSLSELEVEHAERNDPLYFIRYPLLARSGQEPEYIVVATVRPEPIWADTHIAVNPQDKKNKWLVGRRVANPLTGMEMEIIGDEFVDPEFGTGIVKLTPAHDATDFGVAKRLGLPINKAVDWKGRMTAEAGRWAGLKVAEARNQVVEELKLKGLVEKIDDKYLHSVGTCYRCKRLLEPMVIPNWFIKVADLKKPVLAAVKKDEVKFFPKRYKKQMIDWLTVMHDWPISRQIVWGIRIPVWYEVGENANNIWVWWLDSEKKLQHGTVKEFFDRGIPLEQIEAGMQKVYAQTGENAPRYSVSESKPADGKMYLPETDTFDTWFSSGQWPLVTLTPEEYESRLPTDFMGTLSDILPFWISRMMMFSLYLEGELPYKNVYLWSMVADAKGAKMSKSRGNVINPIELVDKYGADALRMALIYGVAPGSKIPLAEEKVRGMRNFANKVWNMGRLVSLLIAEYGQPVPYFDKAMELENSEDRRIMKLLEETIKAVGMNLEKFRYASAARPIYDFMWHSLADVYLEKIKVRKNDVVALGVVRHVYLTGLKLLHPFMPFVTEAVWSELAPLRLKSEEMLISAKWPATI